jgi:hypothetical protein
VAIILTKIVFLHNKGVSFMDSFIKEHIYSIFGLSLIAIMIISLFLKDEVLGWFSVGAVVLSLVVYLNIDLIVKKYGRWF